MSGRIRDFFRKSSQRTHSETAALLGVTDDYLNNWMRRYSSTVAPKIVEERGAAKRRGAYIKRNYENDVVAVFVFAYGYHDDGRETHLAIQLGLQTYKKLEQDLLPLLRGNATDDELRARLNNAIAFVRKVAGFPHKISIQDRRYAADHWRIFSADGFVTVNSCGSVLLGLIDRIAVLNERAAREVA